MSDEELVQKSNVLIKVGGLLGALAVVTTSLATIVKDSSTIWEKLPFEVVPETKSSLSLPSPNPQLNQPQNKENVSKTPFPSERYEYEEDGKIRAFFRVSDVVWKEENEFGKEINTFKEIARDSDFITLYDKSRDMRVKIPIEGGQVLITWPEKNWVDLQYRYVAKKSSTN
ncbi:hypothetical protein [Thermoleptolyngbya sp. M55_K2018_002]|uniref:hypothetical protein n=1 Tax=Thermoleptolyngbya sp. M55_K2018_002 TaxID=2747808 RepID=UPI001A0388A4|nr:hypothetical protein [Thermoleptolyngbya sp. M55_K2018_002]HIK42511.1 hypothetical protein [Thermoleptolyngbya sp. M55_K2018_002]